jgi:hypothetical protein
MVALRWKMHNADSCRQANRQADADHEMPTHQQQKQRPFAILHLNCLEQHGECVIFSAHLVWRLNPQHLAAQLTPRSDSMADYTEEIPDADKACLWPASACRLSCL